MKTTKTSSKEVKKHLLFYLLYRVNYLGAFTEYGGKGVYGIADVIGVSRNNFLHEFEVKVSRQDLLGELEAIKHHSWGVRNGELFSERPEPKKCMAKGTKHWSYLERGDSDAYGFSKPSKFSFVVPEYLEELAMEYLAGTKYGLIILQANDECRSAKPAQFLHKNTVTEDIKDALLRKAANEVYSLRNPSVVDLSASVSI